MTYNENVREGIVTVSIAPPHQHFQPVKGFPMSLFSKILDKLGLRKDKDEEKPGTAGATGSTPSKPATGTAGATGSVSNRPAAAPPTAKPTTTGKPTGAAPTSGTGVHTSASTSDRRQQDDVAVKHEPAAVPAAPVAPKPMEMVDVMSMLEQKAKGTGLNWKQSISDLLFLLDIDNSYNSRVELAKELNAPQEVMGDSARMNTWLHKEVLRKIAQNGGNIPQDLLD
jgi:hypothetical protein